MSGVVVARGRFRVDRKLALEKMEKFQLEDPFRYVIELMAAAVCAGATAIDVTCDSDDLVVAWQGDAPRRDELDAIFDHLFDRSAEPRPQMLQHLAIALLAAHGLVPRPRWVRIDRGPVGDEPAVRLEVRDPTETLTEVCPEPPDGVRVSVREAPGAAVAAAAMSMLFGQPTVEVRLIRGAARWCPVPVVVNGERVPSPEPAVFVAVAEPRIDHRSGRLWLVPGGEPGVIDVLRHGITVAHVPAPVLARGPARFTVAGWLRDDRLRLNASRSWVVEDETWPALLNAVDRAVDTLLRDGLAAVGADDTLLRWTDGGRPRAGTRGELALAAAVPALQRLGRAPLGGLGGLKVLTDTRGRAWSASELAALPDPVGFTLGDPDLADPRDPRPLFHGEMATVVAAALPGKVEDRTAAIARAAEGRRRRAAAEGRRLPAALPPPSRRIDDGPLVVAVRLVAADEIEKPGVTVELRIGGLAVETIERPGPGGRMHAIVDDARLRPDDAFRHIERDAAFDAAMSALDREARAHAHERLRDLPPETGLLLLTSLLHAMMRDLSRPPDARRRLALADDALSALPLFPRGDGARLTLEQVLAAEETWAVVERLPLACPPEPALRALVLPSLVIGHWTRWLRPVRDARAFEHDVARAIRLAAPRLPPVIAGPRPRFCVDVHDDGLRGQLAFGEGDARVHLRRDGVAVTDVTLDVGVPIAGVLDVADLEVDPAHADVARPQILDELAARVAPFVERLVLEHWDAVPSTDAHPLPTGLVAEYLASRRQVGRWSEAVRTRPVGVWGDGRPATLAEIEAVIGKRKGPKLAVLPAKPDRVLALGDMLVAGSALRYVLDAWAPSRCRDGTAEVVKVEALWRDYRARPAMPPAPDALARRDLDGEGCRISLFLPRDPERIGRISVEARWERRVLATRVVSGVGLAAIVDGPAVTPDRTFTAVRDDTPIEVAAAHAERLFLDLVGEALAAPFRPTDAPVWLALRARLGGGGRQLGEARDRVDRLPLLETIDGRRVTVADAIAAASGQAVGRVAAALPAGEAPFLAIIDRPGVADALRAAVGRAVPDRTEEVRAWRAGRARRAKLTPREAVVDGPVWRRAPLDASVKGRRPRVHGEIALRPPGERQALVILPLVDGLPLAPIERPFPTAAAATITSGALHADATFEAIEDTPALQATLDAVEQAVHMLAVEALADADPEWAAAYVLGAVPDAARRAPVFALRGGGRASRADLDARDAVAVVAADGPPFPSGPPPVIASGAVRARLAAAYTLVDAEPIARQLALPIPPPPLPGHAVARVTPPAPLAGQLAFLGTADDDVAVYVGPIVCTRRPSGGPVPLVGWIRHPDLEPTAAWDGVRPGPAADAVTAALRAAARDVVGQLLSGDVDRHRPWLLRALRALADDARDAQAAVRGTSDDALVVRLAAAPLFRDGEGRPGSLADLLSRGTVRAVGPDRVAHAAPKRAPFWRLDDDTRAWLGGFVRVVDAEEDARVEERGWVRRHGPPHPKSPVPSGAIAVEGAGIDGRVWLDGGLTGALHVLVGGRAVQTLDVGVPGASGWIDGAFPTDVGFERVELPDEARAAVDRALAAALTAEAAEWPRRFAERLRAAVAWPKRDVALSAAWSGVVWPLATDRPPISVVALLADVRRHHDLAVGDPVPGVDRIVASRDAVSLLSLVFPGVGTVEADTLAPTGPSRKERKAADAAADRARKKLHAAIADRATGWLLDPLGREARAVVARWADDPPDWLATIDASDPRSVTLAAYAVITAVVRDPGVELAALAWLVEALEEAAVSA